MIPLWVGLMMLVGGAAIGVFVIALVSVNGRDDR